LSGAEKRDSRKITYWKDVMSNFEILEGKLSFAALLTTDYRTASGDYEKIIESQRGTFRP